MASIGPQIPAHLLNQRPKAPEIQEEETKDTSDSIGPQIPTHLRVRSPPGPSPAEASQSPEDDEDEDDYAPPLPPDLIGSRGQPAPNSTPSSSSKRPIGPTFPGRSVKHVYDEDDDEDYGPMPIPGAANAEESDGVREFIEKEKRRQKAAEEAAKPKALKRDEWMLVPPSSSDALGALADPLKLKARQFSRSTNPKSSANNLWTETPAERQQRIADEVSGKKRRAANAEPEVGDEEVKRRKRDEGIRSVIENHNKTARAQTLLDLHGAVSSGQKKKDEDTQSAIWDHSRDMSMGGRLMDEKQRGKLISDSKALGDRFGSSKGGSFL